MIGEHSSKMEGLHAMRYVAHNELFLAKRFDLEREKKEGTVVEGSRLTKYIGFKCVLFLRKKNFVSWMMKLLFSMWSPLLMALTRQVCLSLL